MLMWSSLGCKRLLPDFTLIYCICCQFTAQLTILRDGLGNISCCIIVTNGDFASCVFAVEVTALLSLTSKNDLMSPLSDSYMYKNIWLNSYLIFFNLTSLKKKKKAVCTVFQKLTSLWCLLWFQERPPNTVGRLCPEGALLKDVLHIYPSVWQQRGPVGWTVQEKHGVCCGRQGVWGKAYPPFSLFTPLIYYLCEHSFHWRWRHVEIRQFSFL